MCQYLDHIDSGFSFLDNDGRPIAPRAESTTFAATFLPRVTIRHNNGGGGANSPSRRRVSVPELTISEYVFVLAVDSRFHRFQRMAHFLCEGKGQGKRC